MGDLYKSLRVLCGSVFQKCGVLIHSLSDKVIYRAETDETCQDSGIIVIYITNLHQIQKLPNWESFSDFRQRPTRCFSH